MNGGCYEEAWLATGDRSDKAPGLKESGGI
jgi:hypothetical protein